MAHIQDIHAGNFREVCRISMKLPLSAYEQRGGPKGPYWFAEFEVILDLGATELKASLEWKEDVGCLISFLCILFADSRTVFIP